MVPNEMGDSNSGYQLLDAAAVAGRLGVSIHTLAQWRYAGSGPRYMRVGKHVRYRWSDIEIWLAEQTINPGDAT